VEVDVAGHDGISLVSTDRAPHSEPNDALDSRRAGSGLPSAWLHPANLSG
jgi:hypothetical protein